MTTYLTSINNRAEVIEKTLIDLGYQLSDRGKYWQCNAIYRDGDNRTALQIWKDTGIWKDFVANTTYQPFKRLLELSCKDDSKIDEKLIQNILLIKCHELNLLSQYIFKLTINYTLILKI